MKREQVNYVAVGSFVLACLVGLVWLILQLTGSGTALVRYHVLYPSVHGIIAGTPVFYQGYRVGQVKEISRGQRDGQAMFNLELDISAEQDIPDDSVAHVFESGLLGTVSIDIRGGDSGHMLPPGGFIAGAERQDLLASINAAADEYRGLSHEQLRPLIAKFNARIDSLSATVEDGARSLIAELHQLTASLNRSARRLESVLSDDNQQQIGQIIGNLQHFSADAAKLGGELRHNNRALGEALGQARQLLAHTDQIVTELRPELRESMHDLRDTLRIVSERISSITQHLDDSSRNLNEFSRQIRQNPGLLMGSTPPPSRR